MKALKITTCDYFNVANNCSRTLSEDFETRILPLLLNSLQVYFDGQWRFFGSTFRGGHSPWYQIHRISNSYSCTVANDGQMSKTLPLTNVV